MTWRTLPFDKVFEDQTGGNIKTLQSEYLTEGMFPIIDQGQQLIGGYTDEAERLCKAKLPVVIFGDHTKSLKFVDFPFCLGADGTKILTPKIEAEPRYLFYYLQTVQIPDAGYSRHFKYLKKAEIPLPPLEEQKRIAAILDQADALRRLRTRALTRLNALGQAIFHEMFGDPVENRKAISKRPLGDIVRVSSGTGLVAKNMKGGNCPVYGGNGVNGWHETPTHAAGTIVIGRVGAYCGSVHVTDRPAWITDNALAVTKKTPIDTTYLAFALRIADLNQYAGRAAQPLVSGSRIYPVEILFPALEKQAIFSERIKVQVDLLSTCQVAATRDRTLFTSLQHRAFRGEL